MENQIAELYLQNIKKLLREYKKMGEGAMGQISDEHVNISENENSNSIAIIVKHLCGNMLSRWTNFLNSDGEKEWHDRDSEFEGKIENKTQLFKKWNEGWECLFKAVDPLTVEDLTKIIYIRKEPHNVIEAINKQLTHYSYHIGQIVCLAKLVVSENLKSLSVPKNKSKEFNRMKGMK